MNRDSPPSHDPLGDPAEGNLNAATVYDENESTKSCRDRQENTGADMNEP